jgi:hypothetical protein
MTKLELLKTITSTIVGIGTGKIVHGIISTNVDTESPVDKTTVFAASFVIGGMAAEATKQYTDRMIDEVADLFTSIKTPTEELT